jgi:hypothetical protein
MQPTWSDYIMAENYLSPLTQQGEPLPDQSIQEKLSELRLLIIEAADHLAYLKELQQVFHHCLGVSNEKPELAWTILDACYPPAEASLDEAYVAVSRAHTLMGEL